MQFFNLLYGFNDYPHYSSENKNVLFNDALDEDRCCIRQSHGDFFTSDRKTVAHATLDRNVVAVPISNFQE